MPQDIPLEASETLAFTPECLSGLASPPVFMLRAATTREKRWRRRMLLRAGVQQHTEAEVRAETLAGLKRLWSPEDFEKHSPAVTEYWSRVDEFRLQRRDNPDLEFDYDADEERTILDLIQRVQRQHEPLGDMYADNADVAEITIAATIAVVVAGWEGFDLPFETTDGYLTLEHVERVAGRLRKLSTQACAIHPGLALSQLVDACLSRMSLGEDEEKNSASPSPSEAPPPSSKPSKASGRSKASASSTTTPATA